MAAAQPQPMETTAAPAFDEAAVTRDAKKLTVPKLQAALAAVGADTQGLKAALVERLVATQRAAACAHAPPQQAPPNLAFPVPSRFELMQAETDILTYANRKVTLCYAQVAKISHGFGPKTTNAVEKLFEKASTAVPAGTPNLATYMFPIEQLAALCGPETMPKPTLVDVVYEVHNAMANVVPANTGIH